MILIVVDTGPINYLIQISHIDLLSTLVDKTKPGHGVSSMSQRGVGSAASPLNPAIGSRVIPI